MFLIFGSLTLVTGLSENQFLVALWGSHGRAAGSAPVSSWFQLGLSGTGYLKMQWIITMFPVKMLILIKGIPCFQTHPYGFLKCGDMFQVSSYE